MSAAPLHCWQGREPDAAGFRFVARDLKSSLARVLADEPERPFLHWYPLRGDATTWTYGALSREVEAARAWLADMALAPGTTVCTVEGNSPRHLAMILAILTSGHTLALADPREVSRSLERKLSSLPETLLVVSDRADVPARFRRAGFPDSSRCSDALAEARPCPDPVARILTSGSTGYPKVVEWRESALLANVEALIRHHRLFEKKTVLTPLPVFHVNALTFSFLANLLAGGTLVLMEGFDLGRFYEALAATRADIVSVVPHILSLLAARMPDLVAGPHLPDYFVTAAAPLPVALAATLADELPVPVLQGYGLSEAVNFSCTMPPDLTREEYRHWLKDFERPSVGVELDFNSLHVLDAAGSEVTRDGETGRIGIRGWNVMTAYRGDAGREVFAGEYLQTGDLGCFRHDARGCKYFFVTGRQKEQIKRYGEAVSLGEIDELLLGYPGELVAAIAVAVGNRYAGEEVAVVVQTSEPAPYDFAGLIAYMATQLPEPARPRLYAQTTEPARTTSGKARRWAFKNRLEQGYADRMFGRQPLCHEGLVSERE